MRVIAGSLKGRRLRSPGWDGLRPTSDKLKETLFNILAPEVSGARVLDLYAGSGALGLEAISRGAAWVDFVEQDRRAQQLIAENLELCGVTHGCAIIRAAVVRALEMLKDRADFTPFDIVLLDPPYDREPSAALDGVDAMVADQGIVALEHARRVAAPERAGRLVKQKDRVSGDSVLTFYRIPI